MAIDTYFIRHCKACIDYLGGEKDADDEVRFEFDMFKEAMSIGGYSDVFVVNNVPTTFDAINRYTKTILQRLAEIAQGKPPSAATASLKDVPPKTIMDILDNTMTIYEKIGGASARDTNLPERISSYTAGVAAQLEAIIERAPEIMQYTPPTEQQER